MGNFIGRLHRDTVELELRENTKKNLETEFIPKLEDEIIEPENVPAENPVIIPESGSVEIPVINPETC